MILLDVLHDFGAAFRIWVRHFCNDEVEEYQRREEEHHDPDGPEENVHQVKLVREDLAEVKVAKREPQRREHVTLEWPDSLVFFVRDVPDDVEDVGERDDDDEE